jgi:hypothetical protein
VRPSAATKPFAPPGTEPVFADRRHKPMGLGGLGAERGQLEVPQLVVEPLG